MTCVGAKERGGIGLLLAEIGKGRDLPLAREHHRCPDHDRRLIRKVQRGNVEHRRDLRDHVSFIKTLLDHGV